jgi:hypothetical protein
VDLGVRPGHWKRRKSLRERNASGKDSGDSGHPALPVFFRTSLFEPNALQYERCHRNKTQTEHKLSLPAFHNRIVRVCVGEWRWAMRGKAKLDSQWPKGNATTARKIRLTCLQIMTRTRASGARFPRHSETGGAGQFHLKTEI